MLFYHNFVLWIYKSYSYKRGVTAVEYAIIAVAMSAIILFVFKDGTLKQTLNNAMSAISSKMLQVVVQQAVNYFPI